MNSRIRIKTLDDLQELAVNNPEALLTPGEVAKVFRVHPKTVNRWGRAKRLPFVATPGGHMRFKSMEVCRAMGVFE
jgi:excisionase family DNA binding protein